MIKLILVGSLLLLLLYLFPLLWPVLRVLPWQFFLRQVVLDAFRPLPIWSSSPSFTRTSIPITILPTYSSSLLNTCPYHFNLLCCTFLDISPTFVVPLIISFIILSSLVTPLIHLNILISATSNFFSCAFFTTHVSAPYIITGLTTVLYTFPLTLKLILLSHRIPDTLFQFFSSWLYYIRQDPHPSLHSLPMSLLGI